MDKRRTFDCTYNDKKKRWEAYAHDNDELLGYYTAESTKHPGPLIHTVESVAGGTKFEYKPGVES